MEWFRNVGKKWTCTWLSTSTKHASVAKKKKRKKRKYGSQPATVLIIVSTKKLKVWFRCLHAAICCYFFLLKSSMYIPAGFSLNFFNVFKIKTNVIKIQLQLIFNITVSYRKQKSICAIVLILRYVKKREIMRRGFLLFTAQHKWLREKQNVR